MPIDRPALSIFFAPPMDRKLPVQTWRRRVTCSPYYRKELMARGILSAYEANRQRNDTLVWIAGMTIRPHRPTTKSGNPVLFLSVEDETETVQLIC